jgi:exoribonuclease R
MLQESIEKRHSTPTRLLQKYTRRTHPRVYVKNTRTYSALSSKDLDDAVSARANHQPSVTAPADVAHAFAPHSAM